MYLLIFIFIAICSLLFGNKKPNNLILIAITIFFIFIVGFRGDDVDNDYMMYVDSIKYLQSSGIAEISFKWIALFFYNNFDSIISVFVFYALIGVSLKIYNIQKYSNHFWLSILIYFSTFFILQEMNAIRAGVACGFMMLSLEHWARKDSLKTLMFLGFASFFHYSFFIMIPFALFLTNSEKWVTYYILLIPLAYILYYTLDLTLIGSIFSIQYAQEKFNAYNDESNSTNVFSTVFVIKILLIILLYFFREKNEKINRYFYLFLKLYCVGLFLVITLAKFPAASMRFLDLFVIVELFLIPLLYYWFLPKFRWIPTILIIFYCYFYLYLYVDLAEYIRYYYLIFDAKWI